MAVSGEPDVLAGNGVDGESGAYLLPPLEPRQLTAIVTGQEPDPALLKELQWWHARVTEATFAPAEGVDPTDLAQSGWGLVLPAGSDAAVADALAPLLEHRKAQAGGRFHADLDVRPGESKRDFLARHGTGPGPVDPDKLPYYLLVAGDPEAVPWSFQAQVDVQYAVGRLHLDSPDAYRAYAEAVVRAEAAPRRPPVLSFFATANAGDRATALSSAQLVAPLAEHFGASAPAGWSVRADSGGAATKARLGALLGGADTPALLFTASHGMGFAAGHPRQGTDQGALLCQDWPGPAQAGPVDPAHYFAGADVGDADLTGLVAFCFACFGAGTPRYDEFAARARVPGAAPGQRPELAPGAFVASLPKRLLERGALAVVGHVDRAWGYSFLWPGAGRQTAVYESCLARLLGGHPVGSAFEYFNERYAELSCDLAAVLEDIGYGKAADDLALGAMWTENNDARGFTVLGDPAVRLSVAP